MNFVRTIRFYIIKLKRFWQGSKAEHEKRDDNANSDSSQSATQNKNEVAILIRDAIGLGGGTIFAGLFFGTDHKICGLLASFIGLLAAFHIPFHYWAKKKGQKCKAWGCYSVLMFLIAIWFSFWAISIKKPEPKPYPHLTFSLYFKDFPDDPVMLTNDFLINTNVGLGFSVKYRGALCVPMQSISNAIEFDISAHVNRDSPVKAEDLQVYIDTPPKLSCAWGSGWQKAQSAAVFVIHGSTQELQSWGYDFPDILPTSGRDAPVFGFWPATIDKTFISISVIALNLPMEDFSFAVIPITDSPRHKPFFIKFNNISSNGFSYSKQEIWDNLQR